MPDIKREIDLYDFTKSIFLDLSKVLDTDQHSII